MLDPALARATRLVALDVDGVLTDGGVFVGQVGTESVEFKRFHVVDGIAMRILRWTGFPLVLVSARPSAATRARAAELQVDEVLEVGATEKLEALEAALARRGVGLAECLFMGDDLADLPVLRAVGVPIAVANAAPEVKRVARYVTTAAGGAGAVREMTEWLLQARGEWAGVLATYFDLPDAARASSAR